MSAEEAGWLAHHWPLWARADQLAPTGDWTTWLVLGGRGAGKTRAGAEWVRAAVRRGVGRIALVGETYADVREVMVEGPSGLRAIAPPSERPIYKPARRQLEWPNGAVAQIFSAVQPDRLRGPQFDAAWCDELAKWRHADAAFDNLQFGLRLGARPRQIVTTTPRPMPLLKRLLADPETRLTRAATHLNRAHLAPAFFRHVIARYEGTRLGRQELDAELLEDNPDALWRRAVIETARVREAPELARIVVAVDPPATSSRHADACGIVVAGVADGHGYVLEDASGSRLSPINWARKTAGAYRRHEADRIVAEVNQGGEMVAAVLRQVAPEVPVRPVRASRGKITRAEPVAALYEQGRVHHVGAFAALEDQMCDYAPGMASPDRMDALVWALTDLMLEREAGAPKVRRV